MIDKVKIFAALAMVVAGVYGFYYFAEQHALVRVGAVLASVIAAAVIMLTSTQGQAAWEFAKGARLEVRKVVWPTRKETAQATLVVIALVILIGLFLWLVDAILFFAIYDIVLESTKK